VVPRLGIFSSAVLYPSGQTTGPMLYRTAVPGTASVGFSVSHQHVAASSRHGLSFCVPDAVLLGRVKPIPKPENDPKLAKP
jgi:hypothetical protein